ncbi:MAG TPA: biotin/lipoyl-binding protein, partial [Nitriliruptorales bacterium]
MTRTRKAVLFGGPALVLAVAWWGVPALRGTTPIDESGLARVERGTMVRSVVATGRIEPITKVEIKSKANGIIEVLHVEVGQQVRPGEVLVELDRENLMARVRESRATLQAARAALQAAEAQRAKSTIEAEGPDVEFARRAHARARSLAAENLVAQAGLDEARSALDLAENRQRAARSQLLVAEARV